MLNFRLSYECIILQIFLDFIEIIHCLSLKVRLLDLCVWWQPPARKTHLHLRLFLVKIWYDVIPLLAQPLFIIIIYFFSVDMINNVLEVCVTFLVTT